MGANTLDDTVEGVREHKAKLSGVAVHCIDLWPPVQVGLKVGNTGQDMTSNAYNYSIITSLEKKKKTLQTYVSDYSVQRVDQDKVKGGGRGGGQTDLWDKEETLTRIN